MLMEGLVSSHVHGAGRATFLSSGEKQSYKSYPLDFYKSIV